MTKKPELKPIQKELLRLFKDLSKLLEKNNISYLASGGTMLGSIREKGFIPWDDDMDLRMTRPEYDKLINYARKHNNMIGIFEVKCIELGNSLLPFCKIFDKRYKLNAKGVEGDEDYLFIDIFPIDGTPGSKEDREKFFKDIYKKRKKVGVSRLTFSGINITTKKKYLLPIKYLLKVYTLIRGQERIVKEYVDFCKKYNYNNSDLVCDTVWGDMEKELIEKDALKPIKKTFEDTEINIMVAYDRYLTNVYGDYMTRPKEGQYENHDIEIIKVK